MAITGSPTMMSDDVPGAAQGRGSEVSALRTATSFEGSAPTTVAWKVRPSARVIEIRRA